MIQVRMKKAYIDAGRNMLNIVRSSVRGYRSLIIDRPDFSVSIFRKGSIGYIITAYDNLIMLQKYSYITECYCNVTEKDVHRFIETIEYDRREALP
jgi:hypothetical protein